jgi:carbon-monoxide dehydrogenase medium subunit
VKPPLFRYVRPDSLEGALHELATHGDEAKVLAGGQSLVPLLNFRLARPSVIVDLNLVPELASLGREGDVLTVGAMVRQRTVERSPDVAESCPIMIEALHHVGHTQIRNRGTVGGSIAHADPAAELPAVALATDADIVVASTRGRRTIPSAEFFLGPFTTALEPDEVVTEVRFPTITGRRTAFIELARRLGDFALAGVAAINRADGDTLEVALAAFGVGGTALRLRGAEEIVHGQRMSEEVAHAAGAAASAEVTPFTDVHADADYRRDLIGTLVRRALQRVA